MAVQVYSTLSRLLWLVIIVTFALFRIASQSESLR